MDKQSKLMLSDRELEIAMDPGLILTKRHVLQTAQELFNEQVEVIKKALLSTSVNWPEEILKSKPRIYKGESYKLLPYVIMDYPAVFGKENIFALRTMFWWGNFFSVTLHLTGSYRLLFAKKIFRALAENKEGVFLCINDSQWEHHFESSNYIALNELPLNDFESKMMESSFIKLALKMPLNEWNEASEHLVGFYQKIVGYLDF
jgi:hypothetical protein